MKLGFDGWTFMANSYKCTFIFMGIFGTRGE